MCPARPRRPHGDFGTVTEAQIADAAAAARTADVVIATTSNAKADSLQARMIAATQATGTPVIAVALRDPYDIMHFPDVSAFLATYAWSPVAMTALAETLVGENNPTGTLPVTIPTADGSGILYPFGTGLGY